VRDLVRVEFAGPPEIVTITRILGNVAASCSIENKESRLISRIFTITQIFLPLSTMDTFPSDKNADLTAGIWIECSLKGL
jgi:hypothetical protein